MGFPMPFSAFLRRLFFISSFCPLWHSKALFIDSISVIPRGISIVSLSFWEFLSPRNSQPIPALEELFSLFRMDLRKYRPIYSNFPFLRGNSNSFLLRGIIQSFFRRTRPIINQDLRTSSGTGFAQEFEGQTIDKKKEIRNQNTPQTKRNSFSPSHSFTRKLSNDRTVDLLTNCDNHGRRFLLLGGASALPFPSFPPRLSFRSPSGVLSHCHRFASRTHVPTPAIGSFDLMRYSSLFLSLSWHFSLFPWLYHYFPWLITSFGFPEWNSCSIFRIPYQIRYHVLTLLMTRLQKNFFHILMPHELNIPSRPEELTCWIASTSLCNHEDSMRSQRGRLQLTWFSKSSTLPAWWILNLSENSALIFKLVYKIELLFPWPHNLFQNQGAIKHRNHLFSIIPEIGAPW